MLLLIVGQEDETIDFDQGTKITPFNMKEELEEGHFDKDGMYIFDKTVRESMSNFYILCIICIIVIAIDFFHVFVISIWIKICRSCERNQEKVAIGYL